ncbi:hypothetical protein SpCBS45565_g07653 [Spizellomyces sp. 'palustris']|nr:hypothetical protein SpCBS45565_g07653 [Spizellomyces sp. 'palustris']
MVTPGMCARWVEEREERVREVVGVMTRTTFETVDQGQQLLLRTHTLPNPTPLALRSTNIHSLQWAILYHTNFTDRTHVAAGLKAASNSLDATVDALIELKGDAEYALKDMVDQFERIERALDATITQRKPLSELEATFEDALSITDDVLGKLQVTAITTAQHAKQTKMQVENVKKLLSIQNRRIQDASAGLAPGVLNELFCFSCLSRTQARQLRQDLQVWDECNGEMIGLSKDLTTLGVQLVQFRHNVKLVRSSWRRSAWTRGNVVDQIEDLRGRVAVLRGLMERKSGAVGVEA